MSRRRERLFGSGRIVPLANTRARLPAPSWRSYSHCCGAFTTAGTDGASHPKGDCRPRAGCARSTVAEALKALEWAGVLSWQHRITRIRERCTDLFGRISCEALANAIRRKHEPQRLVGELLRAEISEKQARSIRYQKTIAKLPLAKDIDDFAFKGTPINERPGP
jgi:hypothetical protein